MKRIAKEKHIHRTFPLLFWKRCCNCGKEFRREWGWKALIGHLSLPGVSRWRYACNACLPTRESADEYFAGTSSVSQRPNNKIKVKFGTGK